MFMSVWDPNKAAHRTPPSVIWKFCNLVHSQNSYCCFRPEFNQLGATWCGFILMVHNPTLILDYSGFWFPTDSIEPGFNYYGYQSKNITLLTGGLQSPLIYTICTFYGITRVPIVIKFFSHFVTVLVSYVYIWFI